MDKLLKQNPQFTPTQLANRDLSKYLNYTQFLKLNYSGLVSHNMDLNEHGDITTAYQLCSYNGSAYPDITSVNYNPFMISCFGKTDLKGTKVGFYEDVQPIFFGGSHIPPPDGPPIPVIIFLTNSLGSANGIEILVMGLAGLLIGGATLTFFIKFREAKQLKMTSVPECIVTIIGGFLCYTSLFFYLGDVTAVKCTSRIWLVMMGFVFMIIPVVMKNVRLYIILKSKKRLDAAKLTLMNRVVISAGISIQLALLGYWYSATKNNPTLVVVGTNAFHVCNSVNYPGSHATHVLEGYSLFIYSLLAVMAYMLKDADPMFNESPALSSIFAVTGLLVGIIYILPSNPTSSTEVVQCFCIWLSVTITLVLLFAAKIYDVLFEKLSEKGLLKLTFKSSDGSKSSLHANNASKSSVNIANSKAALIGKATPVFAESKQVSALKETQGTGSAGNVSEGDAGIVKTTGLARTNSGREA
ncbi:UNVERIFIED_CONTAM: hypothetical protein HDU68_002803, partial [Siphonaria sp. JEL0065]